jgi:hypothetical protein
MSTTQSVKRPDVRAPVIEPPRPSKPSSAWYVLGVLVAIGGLVVGLVWGFTTYAGYRDEIRTFQRMPAPGTAELVLDGGPQTIYLEATGDAGAAGDVTVTAVDGTAVPTSDYFGDVQYDAPDGSVGRAFATIAVPAAGTYQVAVHGLSGTIAIGPAVTSSMIASAMGAMFLALGSLTVGVGIVIVTAIRRSKATTRH